jgi:predicted DNA-binding ribbon-helix-helix protein
MARRKQLNRLSMRLDNATLAMLRSMAHADGVSKGALVRELVVREFNARKAYAEAKSATREAA